jgi:hypothetical protein
MGSLGDEKELGFLRTILGSEEPKVNKAIKRTILQLEDSCAAIDKVVSVNVQEEEVLFEDFILEEIEQEPTESSHNTVAEEDDNTSLESNDQEVVADNRLPLELCFLYDEFGIQASEPDDDFVFELSEEFFLNLNNKG